MYDQDGLGFPEATERTLSQKLQPAAEQDREDVALKRADWFECQASVDAERLVFLDETGLKTNFTRLRGWAFGGERLVEPVPAGRWVTSTLVHAIALDGTRAAMVLDGPMDGVCFTGFCESFLSPALQPGDLVVMDNLGSHKSESARLAIESAGAQVVLLPPYSADLNPIEMLFSKLKQLVRSQRPRTFSTVVHATGNALRFINTGDIQACYNTVDI
jgi:transposase